MRIAARAEPPAARLAELYASAVRQLADPRPPLRVGALHTLRLFGQRHPATRQSIVDVFGAYLRMPAGEDRGVRLAAQRILGELLRPGPEFWPGISLDLTGATLLDLDLSGCRVDGDLLMDYTVFLGPARLRGAVLGGPVSLRGAVFHEHAWLERAQFLDLAGFAAVTFHGDAWFGETRFAGRVTLARTDFLGHAWFGGCEARGHVDLTDATFARSAGFRGAILHRGATLAGTTFRGPARVSRRGEEWNLCPPGWRVEVDQDNESVGQLVWSGRQSPPLGPPAPDRTGSAVPDLAGWPSG